MKKQSNRSKRGAPRRSGKVQPKPPLSPQQGRLLSCLRNHVLKTAFSLVAGISAIVGIVSWAEPHLGVNLWPWPTEPEITAQNSNNGSSETLPFSITHRSVFFPIGRAELSCNLNLLYFMDADQKTGIIRDQTFSEGAAAIDPNTSYQCDSKFVRILPNGSLELGFHSGISMATKLGVFRPPMTVLKMCVEIKGDYEILGSKKSFNSAMFQWPTKPTVNQWIKGPIAFDSDQSMWVPAGSKLAGAWALRGLTTPNANGGFDLRPNALRCDWDNVSAPSAYYLGH